MNNEQDPSDFLRMIRESPGQFRVGMDCARGISVEGTFDKIMISGMGGSALPANLLRIYLDDLFQKNNGRSVSIYQNRFYTLPKESYENCLNIISSYSGNTEETLASFEEARLAHLPIIGISAGGKLEELCKKYDIPHILLPLPSAHFQPRIGTGYFFGALIRVLATQGLVRDTEEDMLASALRLEEAVPELEESGRKLAKKLAGKTPVVYASPKYKAVAMVWKIKFNENAKTPAFWNFFPELNHNEMVGFTNPQGAFAVIMLRDKEDHPRNLKRFEATADLLRAQGTEATIIDMGGSGVFEKMFRTILLGDFASYALALEYGTDPTPVVLVEKLKKMLA